MRPGDYLLRTDWAGAVVSLPMRGREYASTAPDGYPDAGVTHHVEAASVESRTAQAAFRNAVANSKWGDANTAMSTLLVLTGGRLDPIVRSALLEVPGDIVAALPGLSFAFVLTETDGLAGVGELESYLRTAAYTTAKSSTSDEDAFVQKVLTSWACRRLGDIAGAVHVAASGRGLLSRMDWSTSAGVRTAGLLQFSRAYVAYGATERARDLLDQAVSAAGNCEAYAEAQATLVALESVLRGRLVVRSADSTQGQTREPAPNGRTYGALHLAIARSWAAVDAHRFDEAMAEIGPWESISGGSECRPYLDWVRLHCAYAAGSASAYIEDLARNGALEPAAGAQLTFAGAALLGAVDVICALSAEISRSPVPGGRFAGQFAAAQMVRLMMRDDCRTAAVAATFLAQLPGHSPRTRAGVLGLGVAAALHLGDRALANEHAHRLSADEAVADSRFHSLYLPASVATAIRDWASEFGDLGLGSLFHADADRPVFASGPVVQPLSERERVVLGACSRLHHRRQVALLLHISENTVKAHLRSVYRKLGVRTLDDAVARATRLGLLR